MPEKSTAEDLADAILAEEGLDSEKVLVVTGNLNRETLVARLEAAQAIVDVFPVYRTTPADLDDLPAAKRFREQGADAVVFASSSAVKSFAQQAEHLQLAPEATRPLLASMGPQTSEAIRKLGLTVGLEASEPSIDALVTAVTLKLG